MTETPLELLLTLQEHDTTTAQLEHRRATLTEREALRACEADLEQLATRLVDVERRRGDLDRSQKRVEDELASVEAKISEVDRRLYSGTVTAPRELQALQDDIAGLKRRRSLLEDQDLEIMEAAEPVDADLAALGDQRASIEAEANRLRSEIAAAEAEVEQRLAETKEERDKLAALLPPELLAHYDELRSRLRGPAAARLVGSSCGGCHLALPATEIDRIKKQPADALIHCEECGCILVR